MRRLLIAAMALAMAGCAATASTKQQEACRILASMEEKSDSGFQIIDDQMISHIWWINAMNTAVGSGGLEQVIWVEGMCHHGDGNQGEILDWTTGRKLLP